MAAICVVDIGGTYTRCALYERGILIPHTIGERIKTPNFRSFDCQPITEKSLKELQSRMVDAIVREYHSRARSQRSRKRVLAIGFPGPVTARGTVLQSSVIFGTRLRKPFDLRSALESGFGRDPRAPAEILITNDMTASAWRYADSGFSPFCLITVSSGIGNKIFASNSVMISDDGLEGELGHVSVPIDGTPIPCDCGSGSNHVGMFSSGEGVQAFARKFGGAAGRFSSEFNKSALGKEVGFDAEKLENKLIARFADRGDRFSRKVIDFCTMPLAQVVSTVALAVYIKKFVLVGGFALNCKYYKASLIENVISVGIYNYSAERIRKMIIYGCRDDNHTLIGLGKMVENQKRLVRN